MSNITELKRRAEALLSQMECGKEYTVGHVSQRLEKAAVEHPQDVVIRAVAGVLDKMKRQNPDRLISQGELDKIYNQLIGLDTSGTRFREVLGDLLLSKKPVSAMPNTQYIESHRDPLQEAIAETEPALTRELSEMFSKASSHYDLKRVATAKDKVGMELYSMGVRNPRVRIVGGNSEHMVFAADLDTNRGVVRIHIPVEASGNKLPSVFVSGERLVELNPINLKAHLDQVSIRSKQSLEHSIGEIEVPRSPVPESLKALTAEIEESVLESAVGYPQMSVRLAKRMLLAELASMGFQGSQVRITAPTSDGFICEATLNTPRGKVAIDVPIEMRDNQPLMPSVFAQNDKVEDFNEVNLKAMLVREPETINIAVCRDSNLLSMSYHDLKDILIKNAVNGDLKTCDEVMEVIAEKFDPEIYRNAISDYQKILTDLGSAKRQTESRCGRILKSSNSIFPLCGHFMVPIHKVVQDENGICHLASSYHARKNQDTEGAFFSNAKILIGDK